MINSEGQGTKPSASLKLIFARFRFRTDILVEENAEELEPTARAVVELEIYSLGLILLLLCGFS
jgi:hypothetical protein